MTTTAVLGIDVSPKRMGLALADLETGAALWCAMYPIDLPGNGWSGKVIQSAISDYYDHSDYEVCLVYIERPWVPRGNTAFEAGRAVQCAVDACRRRWPHAPVQMLQPSEWRTLAGLPGNASKDDVRVFASGLLGEVIEAQDAADALLVAVAGVRRNAAVIDRAAVLAARKGEA